MVYVAIRKRVSILKRNEGFSNTCGFVPYDVRVAAEVGSDTHVAGSGAIST